VDRDGCAPSRGFMARLLTEQKHVLLLTIVGGGEVGHVQRRRVPRATQRRLHNDVCVVDQLLLNAFLG
jgi:hypothetical protein